MILFEVAAGHLDRLAGEVGRVGSHVRDEPYATLTRDIDPFVELLGDPHRAVGRHAQPAAGRLLQSARDERRIGAGPRTGDVDRFDRVAGRRIGAAGNPDDFLASALGIGSRLTGHHHIKHPRRLGRSLHVGSEINGGCVVGLNLQRPAAKFHHLALQRAVVGEPRHSLADQRRLAAVVHPGHERRPFFMEEGRSGHVETEAGRHLPRFGRGEGPDFLFPLHDDPARHALHAAGAQSRGDFLPEDRRNLVADDTVDDAAGLLGLDSRHVDRPRVLKRPLHLRFGDRVKRHPLGRGRIHAQDLRQVPGDRLSFPVEVGGKPDVSGILGKPPEFGDPLGLVLINFVGGGKVMVQIDPRHRLLRPLRSAAGEIPNVAH